jgi:4-hydroxyphenylpyruvate dioxygenase
MQKAIATVSLSGTLDEKLGAIAAAKFRGVEIFENDLLSFNGKPADVRRMTAELGLEIVAFQPFRDFEGMPPARRPKVFDRAERKFDVMQELGCNLLLICSNVSPESLGGIDRAAADLRDLGERAVKRGFRVGFEALAWGRHINDYRDAWEAVRRADHPAIGLVLDSFHALVRKSPLDTICSIPRDRIFIVQVADAPLLDMDYLSWSRHFRNFPGQGELPLLDFMTALQATDFDGPLSLEIFNDQFRAGSARSVAVDGHRSLIYLLDQLRARTGMDVPDLPQVPPRARCLGTEFIEFAIDETAAPSFEAMLSGLGFHRAGLHRSKSVTHWRQGDINLVVNTDKEGFAHSFNNTHGTSVCALALRVEDAAATIDRATRLLDQPFHQAVGPGELDIPAVRGLGGSLVYFVDAKSPLGKLWDIDFEKTAEGAAGGVGLTTVDHISQSMHYEEMLTWLLFYNSLLDVAKAPEQEILDPGGLVKSQVVQSNDGSLRLVLNASQSQRTLSSRFLSEAFGSGVQHIAFATDDLLETVKRLRANGMKLLPVPENYYDDLEAKIDITAEQLAMFKANDILYDRDGEAEYFQVYTETFDDRFFFEIVERRGYRGFGAANAAIRLAAQARQVKEAEALGR